MILHNTADGCMGEFVNVIDVDVEVVLVFFHLTPKVFNWRSSNKLRAPNPAAKLD